ncbi:hypothetical protein FH972_023922 [Carpinus fangiana]|uniref:Uncharacterized protein n=1 Tax=Carpinus fangiana TaxID=176857 RepID=A0A5N6KX83_9ROSI|nr:hypothetical protein FH972_023922 [Carpinus fangiana]
MPVGLDACAERGEEGEEIERWCRGVGDSQRQIFEIGGLSTTAKIGRESSRSSSTAPPCSGRSSDGEMTGGEGRGARWAS